MAGVSAPPAATSEGTLAERLEAVRHRIRRAGADPSAVTIVAVTKGFGPEAVAAAAALGLRDIGENYAQELACKAEKISGAERIPKAQAGSDGWHEHQWDLRWHLLGAPQRNKLAAIARWVDTWEAIDREAVAEAVARHSPGARVFVQVDQTGLPGRRGTGVGEAPALVARCREIGLDTAGLMTVAPPGDAGAARECFAGLSRLARDLGLGELSMGMSDDFEAAVSMGATTIRLGRALFGPRPAHATPGSGFALR